MGLVQARSGRADLLAATGWNLAATAAVLLFHVGLHVPVGEPGIEIGIHLHIPIARQHLPSQPVAAIGAEVLEGFTALLAGPLAQLRTGALVEMGFGLLHLAQQQLLAGQERFDPQLAGGGQASIGLANALGLALGKAGGREGVAGQEIGGGGAGLRPATEQVNLFLNRQERADLLEKGLELALVELPVAVAIEAAAALHQLFEQLQTFHALQGGAQVAADQIKDPVGQELAQLLFQLAPLLGQLAHALQQLQALLQDGGGRLKAALVLVILGGRLAGQAS